MEEKRTVIKYKERKLSKYFYNQDIILISEYYNSPIRTVFDYNFLQRSTMRKVNLLHRSERMIIIFEELKERVKFLFELFIIQRNNIFVIEEDQFSGILEQFKDISKTMEKPLPVFYKIDPIIYNICDYIWPPCSLLSGLIAFGVNAHDDKGNSLISIKNAVAHLIKSEIGSQIFRVKYRNGKDDYSKFLFFYHSFSHIPVARKGFLMANDYYNIKFLRLTLCVYLFNNGHLKDYVINTKSMWYAKTIKDFDFLNFCSNFFGYWQETFNPHDYESCNTEMFAAQDVVYKDSDKLYRKREYRNLLSFGTIEKVERISKRQIKISELDFYKDLFQIISVYTGRLFYYQHKYLITKHKDFISRISC